MVGRERPLATAWLMASSIAMFMKASFASSSIRRHFVFESIILSMLQDWSNLIFGILYCCLNCPYQCQGIYSHHGYFHFFGEVLDFLLCNLLVEEDILANKEFLNILQLFLRMKKEIAGYLHCVNLHVVKVNLASNQLAAFNLFRSDTFHLDSVCIISPPASCGFHRTKYASQYHAYNEDDDPGEEIFPCECHLEHFSEAEGFTELAACDII